MNYRRQILHDFTISPPIVYALKEPLWLYSNFFKIMQLQTIILFTKKCFKTERIAFPRLHKAINLSDVDAHK